MTKSEELKILEQIEKLIESAGADSYIRMTFAGVPEICRRNIEDDFGDTPVQDLEEERKRHIADNEQNGKLLVKVEYERDTLADQLKQKDAEIQKLGHLLDAKTAECEKLHESENLLNEARKSIVARDAEIDLLKNRVNKAEDERDAIVEYHDGLAEMVDKYEMEIMRLKAEVYDLRKWGESPVVPERGDY